MTPKIDGPDTTKVEPAAGTPGSKTKAGELEGAQSSGAQKADRVARGAAPADETARGAGPLPMRADDGSAQHAEHRAESSDAAAGHTELQVPAEVAPGGPKELPTRAAETQTEHPKAIPIAVQEKRDLPPGRYELVDTPAGEPNVTSDDASAKSEARGQARDVERAAAVERSAASPSDGAEQLRGDIGPAPEDVGPAAATSGERIEAIGSETGAVEAAAVPMQSFEPVRRGQPPQDAPPAQATTPVHSDTAVGALPGEERIEGRAPEDLRPAAPASGERIEAIASETKTGASRPAVPVQNLAPAQTSQPPPGATPTQAATQAQSQAPVEASTAEDQVSAPPPADLRRPAAPMSGEQIQPIGSEIKTEASEPAKTRTTPQSVAPADSIDATVEDVSTNRPRGADPTQDATVQPQVDDVGGIGPSDDPGEVRDGDVPIRLSAEPAGTVGAPKAQDSADPLEQIRYAAVNDLNPQRPDIAAPTQPVGAQAKLGDPGRIDAPEDRQWVVAELARVRRLADDLAQKVELGRTALERAQSEVTKYEAAARIEAQRLNKDVDPKTSERHSTPDTSFLQRLNGSLTVAETAKKKFDALQDGAQRAAQRVTELASQVAPLPERLEARGLERELPYTPDAALRLVEAKKAEVVERRIDLRRAREDAQRAAIREQAVDATDARAAERIAYRIRDAQRAAERAARAARGAQNWLALVLQVQRIVTSFNVIVTLRPVNPASIGYPQAVPKPLGIKWKASNSLDLRLGGPQQEGLVAVFPPGDLPKDASPALKARWEHRSVEWRAFTTERKLDANDGRDFVVLWEGGEGAENFRVVRRGDPGWAELARDLAYGVELERGLVLVRDPIDDTVKPFRSDADLFDFFRPDGTRLANDERGLLERYLCDADIDVRHGANESDWPAPKSKSEKGALERLERQRTAKAKIREGHLRPKPASEGGNEQLVAFIPGHDPQRVWADDDAPRGGRLIFKATDHAPETASRPADPHEVI